MTHCTSCNAIVGDEAKFCSACGATLNRASGIELLRSAKGYVCNAADDIIDAGQEVVTTELGKKMAAGAAVGALCVAPIPVVGWAAGAAVGAGIVAFKHALKRD